MTSESTFSKSVLKLAGVTVALLLIPFAGMQFTGEIDWTLLDFVVAGTLIFGTGFSYILITRSKAHGSAYRLAVGFALFTGFIMIWGNLAVGLIGPEMNFINLLYFVIVLTGMIGALVSRFQIHGMIISMFSCAIGVGIITFVAFLTGMHNVPGSSVIEVLVVNGFFALLFVVGGLLFKRAEAKIEN